MAAARLASTVLAGRRRAASAIIAAGIHVHPRAAFPSPALPAVAATRHGVVAAGARYGGGVHLHPRAAFPSTTLPAVAATRHGVVAAGARYGGGVHLHPRAAFPSPTLPPAAATATRHGIVGSGRIGHLWPPRMVPPPKPRAFSSSGEGGPGAMGRRRGGDGGGAPRGGSFLGWTKSVDLDLTRILTKMEMLVKTTDSHKALLNKYAQALEKLQIVMETNQRNKRWVRTLFLMASVLTVSFGVYSYGVSTGRVDVNGFLKSFIIDILDDPTISVKMHDYVEDLAGTAVESINPIRKFVNWLSGKSRPAHYQKLSEEILDYYANWSSILAFVVNAFAKSQGGKISEKVLWSFLIKVGVQESTLNKALLNVLVRERFILREEHGGAITYKMVESGYGDRMKGTIQERIRPILKNEFVMPAAACGPKSKPSH